MFPDDDIWRYLVYLKYWTLNLTPIVDYPKVLFNPNVSLKYHLGLQPSIKGSSYRSALSEREDKIGISMALTRATDKEDCSSKEP